MFMETQASEDRGRPACKAWLQYILSLGGVGWMLPKVYAASAAFVLRVEETRLKVAYTSAS
jgi:hypothetical protein